MKRGTARRTSAIVTVLLLTWVAAGAANATGVIMGLAPTPVGVIATSVMVCSWLAAGWLAGAQSETGFVRSAVVVWAIILVGGPIAFWALTVSPGGSVTQGGWVLPLVYFSLAAPLYGLSALLSPFAAQVQSEIIGIATLAMTLLVYRISRNRAKVAVRAGAE